MTKETRVEGPLPSSRDVVIKSTLLCKRVEIHFQTHPVLMKRLGPQEARAISARYPTLTVEGGWVAGPLATAGQVSAAVRDLLAERRPLHLAAYQLD